MRTYHSALLGAFASLLLAGAAQADILVFSADLGPEAPGATGSGTTTVTFDTDLQTMRVQAEFSGLSGNTTAAHIHAFTPTPFTGTAGVATTVPVFPGFPLGVTSGTYDMTFDMTEESSFNPAFITAQGGTAESASAALLSALLQGRAYLNIHSETFRGGEIRGFPTVPDGGASLALLSLGLGALGAVRRRFAR